MTHLRITSSKIAHSTRLKSNVRAGFILTTLILMVAMAATPAAAQTYTVLYTFVGPNGMAPQGVLAEGRDGNLYGTTPDGGTNRLGVVFRITPTGKLDVLHRFDGVHGFSPRSGLTLGTDGSFFGTTPNGGDTSCDPYLDGCGTVFRITSSGSFAIVHSFTVGTGGVAPQAPPIQADDGSFYGTTSGTAYKITPSGNFTLLASLPLGAPVAPLLQGTDGNFYATIPRPTLYNSWGLVSKITSKGIVTTIYAFEDPQVGGLPDTPLIQGDDGNFYGTAQVGGINVEGVVYKLTPTRSHYRLA